MKRMKKIISLLLAVVMLLGVTSVFAQAAKAKNYDDYLVYYSMSQLKRYIEKNGIQSSDGDSFIAETFETDSADILAWISAGASATDLCFVVSYSFGTEKFFYTSLEYDFRDLFHGSVSVTHRDKSYVFTGDCKVDLLNYVDDKRDLNFDIIDNSMFGPDTETNLQANLMFANAFLCWYMLLEEHGFYISQFGFSKYCPGHSGTFSHTEKEATCYKTGIKRTLCAYCGLIMNEETIPAGNHRWNKGVVTKEATCNTAGEKLLTCKDCGATKTEAIPATGKHNYSKTVTPATTTSNGSVAQVCADCGAAGTTKTIHRIDTVTLDANSFTYDGTAKTPAVTVKDIKGKVVNPKYYTVKYADDCTEIGAYKVKVVFKGLYSGTASCTFKIVPDRVTDLRAASKKTGIVKVAWSPVDGAQKYVIYCSATKKGGYQKVAVTAKTAYNVKDLASGKTYYFIVKALTQTGGKNYFSTVSNIAKARVK